VRVSLSWLKDFVDVDIPVEKLKDLLDLSGTKVASITMPAREVGGVVVAYVQEIVDHPNADNLVLVDITVDGDAQERVVCGARNFKVGDRVPYAAVGARLPGGMEITERKIRGEVSRGMLCSGAELGISKDHSGILVLPEDAPLGNDVTPILGLDDTVIELEITTNRPDCMGMIGIAREVGALLKTSTRLPDDTVETDAELKSRVVVDIEDPEGCPRYLARFISEVSIAPSPGWMARRLIAGGVRPISNVVDVTNYVLLETGQPLNAFDAAKIHDQRIIVRRAKDSERLTTLDGVERKLHRDDLLIADRRHPLAFAGVMGGEDSEVSAETRDLILESAYFDKASISYTSRRHQLRTEASARFERGMDPEMVPFAAARAARLFGEVAGGRVAESVVDAYPRRHERPVITLRPARTNSLLGYDVPSATQAEHLRAVAFEVAETDNDLAVTVPSHRPDVAREEDLIEEVARLAGFDRIPSTLPPGRIGGLEREQALERSVRRILTGFGLHEAMTTSFMSPAELDLLGFADDHPARRLVLLDNPTSEEEPALRTTLLPGLLRSVAKNHAHKVEDVALFEIARVYEPTDQRLPTEGLVLGAAFSGERTPPGWDSAGRMWDFFSAKGVIEGLLDSFGAGSATYETVDGSPFHPTRAASVALDGKPLGSIGQLHPDVTARFDIPDTAVAFEIALAPLFAAIRRSGRFEELPRFPANYIDLAVIVDGGVPASRVFSVIATAGAPALKSLRLFDLYTGAQIGDGKKSLAFALELRDPERTLTDDDVVKVRERIVEALADELGGRLRT
jgi:phenylalanyl-tRNA synthetase beta chain